MIKLLGGRCHAAVGWSTWAPLHAETARMRGGAARQMTLCRRISTLPSLHALLAAFWLGCCRCWCSGETYAPARVLLRNAVVPLPHTVDVPGTRTLSRLHAINSDFCDEDGVMARSRLACGSRGVAGCPGAVSDAASWTSSPHESCSSRHVSACRAGAAAQPVAETLITSDADDGPAAWVDAVFMNPQTASCVVPHPPWHPEPPSSPPAAPESAVMAGDGDLEDASEASLLNFFDHLAAPSSSPHTSSRSRAGSGAEAAPDTHSSPGETEPTEQKLDAYQERAVQLALQGYNLFITGGAGTGKSQTLRRIVAALRTRHAGEASQLARVAARGGGDDMAGAGDCDTPKSKKVSSSSRRSSSSHEPHETGDGEKDEGPAQRGAYRPRSSSNSGAPPPNGSRRSQAERQESKKAKKPSRLAKQNLVFITATTGIAAVQLGGTTIFSFAGIGLGRGSAEAILQRVRRNRRAALRWKSCRTLIIDEVSMLDPIVLERLDYVARRVRRQVHAPFGGIQVIMCGDFHQLAPIPRKQSVDSGADTRRGGGGGGGAGLVPPKLPGTLLSYAAVTTTALSAAAAAAAALPLAASHSTTASPPYLIHDLDSLLAPPPPSPPRLLATAATAAKPSPASELADADSAAADAVAHATRCVFPFQTVAWQRLQPIPVVLRHAHRQAEDATFQRILEEVRRGELSMQSCWVLEQRGINPNQRARPSSVSPPLAATASQEAAIRLCATNSAVEARNAFFYAQLPPRHPGFGEAAAPAAGLGGRRHQSDASTAAPQYVYTCYDTLPATPPFVKYGGRGDDGGGGGRFGHASAAAAPPPPPSSSLAEESQLLERLPLKVGTRVLLVSNVCPRHHLVNGTVGEVRGFLHPLELAALVSEISLSRLGRRQSAAAATEAAAEVQAWMADAERRGGFPREEREMAILNCVDTFHGLRMRELLWRSFSALRDAAATTSAATCFGRRDLERRGGGGGRPGKPVRRVLSDAIPYDVLFSGHHYINLDRVVETRNSQRRRGRGSGGGGGGGYSHYGGDEYGATAHSPQLQRSHLFSSPSSCAAHQQQQRYGQEKEEESNDEQQEQQHSWPWQRSLRETPPEELHTHRLPIVRFVSPASRGRAPPIYAMVCPTHVVLGDCDGEDSGRADPAEEWMRDCRDGRTSSSSGPASRTQLPLRHAWALTIHKSQGLTLSPVQVDMNGISSPGQAYVALSRAPALSQLFLLNFNPAAISASRTVKKFYASLVEPTNGAETTGETRTGETAAAAAAAPDTADDSLAMRDSDGVSDEDLAAHFSSDLMADEREG